MLEPIIAADLEINNDVKILATALNYDSVMHPDDTMFVTEDFPNCYIQQYACDGSVYGINADVDLNVIVDSKMIITPESQTN